MAYRQRNNARDNKKSLQRGGFPENWKTAMVTPIEKVAKTKRCDEHRPINTLKTCEKITKK